MSESQSPVPSPEHLPIQQGIIDHVPAANADAVSSTGPDYMDYDYDPNNPVTAPHQVDTTKDSLLSGPRKTGQYQVGDSLTVAAVSADGMKYTKQYGPSHPSASEFHKAKGVAQLYELEAGKAETARGGRFRNAARQVLHTLSINHPPKQR